MKFLSVAIIIALVSAVVFAAPSSQQLSVDDVLSFDPAEIIEFGANKNRMVDQAQCVVNVIGTISEENGLGELWKKTQPEVQQKIDSWRQCANRKHAVSSFLCKVKEGFATYRLLSAYLKIVNSENSQVLSLIGKEISRKCGRSSSNEEASFLEIQSEDTTNEHKSVVDRLKCIVDAINSVIKKNDAGALWEQHRKLLEASWKRLQKCHNLPSKAEALKCSTKEVRFSYSVLIKYTQNASKVLLDEIKAAVKQQCS